MIVVYATAADEVAEDGNGRNSPFTSALLTRIDEAGLEITQMLKLVGADVSAQTRGRQRPQITVQSCNDYFVNQRDRIAWEKIKDSDDPSASQDFVNRLARLGPPVQTIPANPTPLSPMPRAESTVSTQHVPTKPASCSPLPNDQSPVHHVLVATAPPAQQPVQPVGPCQAIMWQSRISTSWRTGRHLICRTKLRQRRLLRLVLIRLATGRTSHPQH
jgi:hypothetical protein